VGATCISCAAAAAGAALKLVLLLCTDIELRLIVERWCKNDGIIYGVSFVAAAGAALRLALLLCSTLLRLAVGAGWWEEAAGRSHSRCGMTLVCSCCKSCPCLSLVDCIVGAVFQPVTDNGVETTTHVRLKELPF
jgi:hypothetical protein